MFFLAWDEQQLSNTSEDLPIVTGSCCITVERLYSRVSKMQLTEPYCLTRSAACQPTGSMWGVTWLCALHMESVPATLAPCHKQHPLWCNCCVQHSLIAVPHVASTPAAPRHSSMWGQSLSTAQTVDLPSGHSCFRAYSWSYEYVKEVVIIKVISIHLKYDYNRLQFLNVKSLLLSLGLNSQH